MIILLHNKMVHSSWLRTCSMIILCSPGSTLLTIYVTYSRSCQGTACIYLVNKTLLECGHTIHLCTLLIASLILKQQNWVVVTETCDLQGWKYFLVLYKKICQPLVYCLAISYKWPLAVSCTLFSSSLLFALSSTYSQILFSSGPVMYCISFYPECVNSQSRRPLCASQTWKMLTELLISSITRCLCIKINL